jgi:branched-chain amino acid transport system ATP-binding protein
MMRPNSILLEVSDVSTSYGEIKAISGVSVQVREGGIITVLGANGAGKSTLLMTISGMERPHKGDILYCGQSIVGLSPEKIAKTGISHVPEGRRIFTSLSVEENLLSGACFRKDKKAIKQDLERMYQYFPVLKERRSQRGGTLSGGELQMLAIGRGLMGSPKLLLLDEPSLGIAPILVQQIFEMIKIINNKEKVTVLLVEQNVELALAASEYGYVLESGCVSISGTAEELYNNKHVRESYLGKT